MRLSPARRVLVAFGLTVCAFVALVLMFVPVLLLPISDTGQLLLAFTFPELAFAAVGLLFLIAIGEDRSFVEFDRPTIGDGVLITVGTVALVLLNLGVHWLFTKAGFATTSQFSPPPGIDPMVVLAGLSIVFLLVVGPSEELFFRGVVQRYLNGALSRRGAYAWTSLLFAVFHLPGVTGSGGGIPQYALVGSILFVVSWSLGWLYDRSRNILVPSLVHSLYNTLVFATLVFGVMP